jgi:hypothetical protein
MTSRANRWRMPSTSFATMGSIGLAASLAVTGCSGANDEGSSETRGAESLVKSVELESLISTEKIRSGFQIDYDDHVNGVVFVRNGTGSNATACTAQVINRWFLLTSINCVLAFQLQTTTQAEVRFTLNTGATVTKYNGPVNFSRAPAVLGLIFLQNGMDTCHGTLSSCTANQYNTPENAVHQFFVQSHPTPAIWPEYGIAGYGPTTSTGTNYDDFRYGRMPYFSSAWSGSGNSRIFTIRVSWTNSTARPCTHDTGGPLIPTAQNRVLHTGVHIPSANCDLGSGNTPYHALSDVLVQNWLFPTMLNFMGTSIYFRCGVAISGGLAAIHCDNDGSLYPP